MQGRLVGLEEPLLGQVGSFHPKKRYSDSSEKRAEYKVTLNVEIANFSQPGGIPLHPHLEDLPTCLLHVVNNMKFRLAAETFHVSFVKSLSHIRRRRAAPPGKRSDGRRSTTSAAAAAPAKTPR